MAVEASAKSSRADETIERARSAARRLVGGAVRSAEGAAAHAVELIRDHTRAFTHSRSSTVLLALKLALKVGTHTAVIAAESRPLMEGRALSANNPE
jgi:translation initiation factor 2B subunit (eIF-2B alpha/beta/delta family)